MNPDDLDKVSVRMRTLRYSGWSPFNQASDGQNPVQLVRRSVRGVRMPRLIPRSTLPVQNMRLGSRDISFSAMTTATPGMQHNTKMHQEIAGELHA